MTRAARAGGGSLLISASVALISVLALAGCGGSHTAADSQPTAQLHDAIRAPKARELHRGMSVRITPSVLHGVGWQASCSANGRRVNAEAVRGQSSGSGRVAGFGGGSPSIWVTHNGDGSITVSCR